MACPRCGWFQHEMISTLKRRRGISVAFLLALSGTLVALLTGHLSELFTPAAGLGWLGLSAAAGLSGYFLANPNAGFQTGEGHVSRAESSLGLPLSKGRHQAAVTVSPVQSETLRYLRRALVTMASIDGVVETEELEAIARLYYRVTDEDVLLRTLEIEAEDAMGQEKKLLKNLKCLSPYLQQDSKTVFVESVLEVAAADGRIDPKEVELAQSIGRALGVSDSEVGKLIATTKTPAIA